MKKKQASEIKKNNYTSRTMPHKYTKQNPEIGQ
jgi:hypothetical protein